MSTTPPRNVIYYNDAANPIPLAGIARLAYTDVILGFLLPDGNGNLTGQGYGSATPGNSGAFDANGNPNSDDIRTLQNAGKNVLISLGGQTMTTDMWQQYTGGVDGLVQQVAGYVTSNNLNGVDIDYEDNNGFTGVYDGIQFLIDLTNGLAQVLPPGQNIITHAPAPGYFYASDKFNDAYTQILAKTGDNISWFNCQYYNNPPYDGTPVGWPSKDGPPPVTPADKVSSYSIIAETTGASKLLIGTPLSGSARAAGSGYLPLDQFTSQVIGPLRQQHPGAFGGVMGWEFAYDQDGTWADGVGLALHQQHVFYRGTDSNLHHAYSDPATGPHDDMWTSDGSVAGDLATLLGGGTAGPQQHVFYRGTDNNIYHAYWDPAGVGQINHDQWTHDGSVAGGTATLLGGGGAAGSQQHVFYRGTDNNVHHVYWNPGTGPGTGIIADTWTSDGSVSSNLATLLANGQQHVFYMGTDSNLHHAYWDPNTGPHADQWTYDGPGAAGPLATLLANGQQHVFFTGFDGNVHHVYWNPGTGPGTGIIATTWTNDGKAAGPLATLLANGQQHVFYMGTDSNLHHVYSDPDTGPHADQWTYDGPGAAGPLATLLVGGQQHVFFTGFDGNVHHVYWNPGTGIGTGIIADQWTSDGKAAGPLATLLTV